MDDFKEAIGAEVPLESVLCTEQLEQRPSRPPDYQAEIQSLLALVQELKNAPRNVLQRLVDTALELCRGHSAGISLLEEGPPGHLSPRGDQFRWHAVAGQWAPLIWHTTTRRDNGPCGTVLDRDCTLLFANAHRHYLQFAGVQPLLIEGLLVPFHVDGQAVGTVWVVAHDDSRKFDAEDRRLLESLATFAATAYQVLANLSAFKQQAEALRESEARFRYMADNAPVMIWVTEPDASCSFLSQSWYEFTGQTPETGLGFGWLQATHPDDQKDAHDVFSAANEKHESFRLEYRLRRNDGEYRWAIDVAVPRFGSDGTLLGYIGSVIDITERKQAEQELREADRRKSEFLAMMAHELRNPLAPIRNATEILRRSGGDEQQVKSATAIMHRQVGQMSRLIDDLADVSRISRGKIELRRESIELASVVHLAVEAVRPMCKTLGHELTVSLPPQPVYLHADPTRLTQIVGNLLNNACKFTEKGGRIRLNAEQEGGQAVIQVQDTGIGIAADLLPRIFEMFTQVDTSLERSRDGLGIGLTLVKKLVEMHGGTVEARSAGLGRGSEFVVRLPVVSEPRKTRPQAPSGVKQAATTQPAQRRILVVDDNRDAADSVAMLLKLSGHEVHIAHDGLEAVDAAAKFQPDVILLDIGLPRLDGYEAARRIRKQQRDKGVMLVALTGWGQEEDRRRSEEAGFDLHMVKPVDFDALTKLLAELGAG